MDCLTYRIQAHRAAHAFAVRLRFRAPEAGKLVLRIPAWVPGSYTVRDLAGHVSRFLVHQEGRTFRATKCELNAWETEVDEGLVEVTYRVYAFDASVRLAYLDDERAFFNPTSLLVAPDGAESLPVRIAFEDERDVWATPLPLKDGFYEASNLYAAYDAPFESGFGHSLEFTVQGAPHRAVFSGDTDGLTEELKERLRRDMAAVADAVARFFDPAGGRPPFERYLCVACFGKGFGGGLEHAASCVLCAEPGVFKGEPGAYEDFLELFAHEYFHAWWVKRVRPSVYVSPDLSQARPSGLLWVFEGFTVYYAALMLREAGLIDETRYLEKLSELALEVMTKSAATNEPLEEASLEAWIKYYRPDGDRPNAVTSYYSAGALVALGLDAALAAKSEGRWRLADVLRHAYGQWKANPRLYAGIPEGGLPELVSRATEIDLGEEIALWTREARLPDFAELAPSLGMRFGYREDVACTRSFGVSLVLRYGRVFVKTVSEGSCAASLGLAQDDEMLRVGDQAFGEETTTDKKALDAIFASLAGKKVRMQIRRFGREKTLASSCAFEPGKVPFFSREGQGRS